MIDTDLAYDFIDNHLELEKLVRDYFWMEYWRGWPLKREVDTDMPVEMIEYLLDSEILKINIKLNTWDFGGLK